MEKLIRHLIPEIAAIKGEALKTRTALPAEMPNLLREKIREEVAELLRAPSPEMVSEAADVIEAVFSYCRYMGHDAKEVSLAGLRKTMDRGVFDRGVVLITEPDA